MNLENPPGSPPQGRRFDRATLPQRFLLPALMLLTCLNGCLVGGNGTWPLVVEWDGAIPLIPLHPRQPQRSITVATYNLSQLYRPEQVRADISATAADVWLFQEVLVSGNDAAQTLRSILPDEQWHFATVRVNPGAQTPDIECQAIASRFPILRAQAWPLAARSQRRRCALAVWIEVEGREVLVVNTDHEPAFMSLDVMQDHLLAALIANLQRQPAGPVVVGGDFNTCGNFWRLRSSSDDSRRAIHLMHDAGFEPTATAPTISYHQAGLCLDHLFYRDARLEDSGVKRSSDGPHFPVWARIRFDTP